MKESRHCGIERMRRDEAVALEQPLRRALERRRVPALRAEQKAFRGQRCHDGGQCCIVHPTEKG